MGLKLSCLKGKGSGFSSWPLMVGRRGHGGREGWAGEIGMGPETPGLLSLWEGTT